MKRNLGEETSVISTGGGILRVHSHPFEEGILTGAPSVCDGHLRLLVEPGASELVETMEMAKVRSADMAPGSIISLSIEPGIGMRGIPISKVRVLVVVATEQAGHAHGNDPFDCPLFGMLDAGLQEQSREKPHLWNYIHELPVSELGVPQYAAKLGKEHKEISRPNIVYPAGKDIFIHIMPDEEDARDLYNAVEPNRVPNLDRLAQEVDNKLVDHVDQLKIGETPEEKMEVLLGVLEDIVEMDDGARGRRFFGRGNSDKIKLNPTEMMALKYVMVRDKLGLGPLEPMITDTNIEDISCSGVGALFVEHKVFGGLKANIAFQTEEDLDAFVIKLSERIGRPVTFRDPIVDAVLPDGSRVNIVFGRDVSRRGSNFTIRKFSETPLSILDLIDFKALNYTMAAYLSFMMREGMNIFVSGETASGKTTLLNAITAFINPNAKIVTIEDTPEVQVPHPNWVREVVRGSADATGSSVTMMDLLKSALRQRPDEIIIGEIRGEEGAVAFQAMQTGHACMATFHASSVEKLIQRLTGHPINVPRTYVDTLNVVVIASQMALPSGRPVRRLISVNEIVSYDPATDSFSFVEIFRWNPYTDTHEFVGNYNSYLLEQVIAPKRGISPNNRRRIYGELEQRAEVLEKLHSTGHTGFYDFYQVLSKAYQEGLFR